MKNTKKEVYADFDDAFTRFLIGNCARISTHLPIGEDVFPYLEKEICIHLNAHGGGYIRLLNEDSETIDFLTMNHYKLTNTPKPEHLL